MLTISCWNPECPVGKFDWIEPMGYAPALSSKPDAKEFGAVCPHCTSMNFFHLIQVEEDKMRNDISLPIPSLTPSPTPFSVPGTMSRCGDSKIEHER